MINAWFTCKTCKVNVGTCEKIIEHCLILHSEKVFACSMEDCYKYFKSSNGLRLHCTSHHSDVLKCEHCSKVCTSHSNLTAHIDAAHLSAKYHCNHCNEGFTRGSDTKRHWNYSCTANPNRYMRCKHCQLTDVDPDVYGAEPGMINHLHSVHGQTGKYLCVYCHNLFAKKFEIDSHQKKCSKTHPVKPDLAIAQPIVKKR